MSVSAGRLKYQPIVALAYMTGILPVKKYGLHSALNMFWEYSMTNQDIFEEYTGFTEHEVKELCNQFDMDYAETSNWYDGYMFRKFQHVYNPRSVVAAMRCHDFSNYWNSTETPSAAPLVLHITAQGRITKSFGNSHQDTALRTSSFCRFLLAASPHQCIIEKIEK